MRKLSTKQKKEAIKSLKMLDGLPPYDDGGNICMGDGIFAKSIEQDFNMSLSDLRIASGYIEVEREWKRMRNAFLMQTDR